MTPYIGWVAPFPAASFWIFSHHSCSGSIATETVSAAHQASKARDNDRHMRSPVRLAPTNEPTQRKDHHPSFGAKGALQANFHQARTLFLHFYLFLHIKEPRGVSIYHVRDPNRVSSCSPYFRFVSWGVTVRPHGCLGLLIVYDLSVPLLSSRLFPDGTEENVRGGDYQLEGSLQATVLAITTLP